MSELKEQRHQMNKQRQSLHRPGAKTCTILEDVKLRESVSEIETACGFGGTGVAIGEAKTKSTDRGLL